LTPAGDAEGDQFEESNNQNLAKLRLTVKTVDNLRLQQSSDIDMNRTNDVI